MKPIYEPKGVYSVYKHTTPSNKVYIGITAKKPIYRWNNGKGYVHNQYFTNAINKYGWENIQHEILCSGLTKTEAEKAEINFIKFYNSTNMKNGYNFEFGGNANKEISEETRKRMSEAAMLKMKNPELRAKISNSLKGRKASPETLLKLSIARTGKPLSQEHRKKLCGKIRSKEHCEKISASKMGHVVSEQTIAKIKATRKRKIVMQFTASGELISAYESLTSAAKTNGFSKANILQCCKGRRKTASGFMWKYAKEGIL